MRDGKFPEALALYERAIPKIPRANKQELSAAFINAGNCYAASSKLNEAFADFQKATEVDPENIDARLHLAEFFIAAGVPNHAREHLDFVLSRNPDDAAALGMLGTIESAAQHYDIAKKLLEKSVANDPQRPTVAVALAEIYNREDKIAQARSVLVKAASAASDVKKSAYAWLALGRLEEQEGIAAAAEEAYRSAVKADDSVLTNFRLAQFLERSARIEEAEKVLVHLDSLRPGEPSALADFHLSAGHPEKALKQYAEKLPSDPKPDNKSAAQHATPETLTGRIIEAQMQLDRERGTQANGSLSAKLLLSKHSGLLDGTATAVLATETALADGDVAEAETQARIAVTRGPDSAAAHYVRGLVFNRLDKIAEAKEEWNSALDAESDYVPAQLALARQNLHENDLPTAEEHVSSVIREEPANLDALCLYARVLLAQGRVSPARGIAKRAMAVDGNAEEPQLVLGMIDLHDQRFGSALLHFQHSLVLNPRSAEAMNGMLDVYRQGKLSRAVLAKMEKVASAPPSSASLMEITGRLYLEKHLLKDAVRVLSQVLQSDPMRDGTALALAQALDAEGHEKTASDLVLSAGTKGSSALFQLQGADAQERGDYTAAIESYENAMRSGESSGVVANNLAWTYAQSGTNLDRALELARSAVEREPKNAAALDTLGVVQLKRRHYSQAVGALNKAVSMMVGPNWDAQRPEVYRHLAEAYQGAGLPEKSAEALGMAQHSISRSLAK
ncbi:MAG: Tetratricopeptide repeat protein [Acidobacteriales bacterium]|nr:Tetratricopeptide repeat protein [Terriglobales bacterium]